MGELLQTDMVSVCWVPVVSLAVEMGCLVEDTRNRLDPDELLSRHGWTLQALGKALATASSTAVSA